MWILTLDQPDPITGQAPDRIAVYTEPDLNRRITAAHDAGLSYTITEL